MRNARIKPMLADKSGRKAWRVYTRSIRPMARRHRGEFAAVDAASGEYVLADTGIHALARLREIRPKAKAFLFRIGGLARLRTWLRH
jgi:hypothetical protein